MNAATLDRRVDWFRVFYTLKVEGYSYYTLAALTGIPKNTLCGWAYGAEPKHADGERLIAFWCDAMGKGRADLPMTVRELSAAKVRQPN